MTTTTNTKDTTTSKEKNETTTQRGHQVSINSVIKLVKCYV
jgi:hypothetical protein